MTARQYITIAMTTFKAGRAALRWRAERRRQRIERAVRGVDLPTETITPETTEMTR